MSYPTKNGLSRSELLIDTVRCQDFEAIGMRIESTGQRISQNTSMRWWRALHNMQLKPVAIAPSDVPLRTQTANGFAIVSQLMRSVTRRLTRCYTDY